MYQEYLQLLSRARQAAYANIKNARKMLAREIESDAISIYQQLRAETVYPEYRNCTTARANEILAQCKKELQ